MTSRTRWLFFVAAALVVAGCRDASLSGSRTARAQSVTTDSVTTRRIWSGAHVNNMGAPSPDGRWLTFTDYSDDSGSLTVRDIASGETRVLVKAGPAGPRGASHSDESLVSPDGRQVAYIWDELDPPKVSLRLINVDGSGMRVLRTLEEEWATPEAWSPDGAEIAAIMTRRDNTSQIALIATSDGSTRVLKSLGWRTPTRLAFSPDGHSLAYDLPRHDGSSERDIIVIATDGRREHVVVEHSADDHLFGWSPDGKAVVFLSDRGPSPGVWAIDVAEGRAASEPRLLKKDMWRVAGSLGTDRSGAVLYAVQPTTTTVHTVHIDPRSGDVAAPASPLDSGVEFKHSAVWSPDGRSIAYLKRVLGTSFGGSQGGSPIRLVVKGLDTGETRELSPRLLYLLDPQWFPDGQSLLARGTDERGRNGLFRIDARTGSVTNAYHPPNLAWGLTLARDGKTAFFRGGSNEVARLIAYDFAADEERELFSSPNNLGRASPSPDGLQVAFSVLEPGPAGGAAARSSIYVMPARGGTPREVVKLPEGVVSYPGRGAIVWDQAGHLIFVTSDAKRQTHWMSRVALTGGPIQKLDVSVPDLNSLSLHPDGRRLAFQGGENSLEIWVMEPSRPGQ